MDQLIVRKITPGDAVGAAGLSEELGYPASADEMSQRIELLSRRPDQAVYAACIDGDLVGWIDLAIVYHLASEPRAEICGLVVTSGVRSKGVGRRLVAHAEQWAKEKGVTSMLVRSQIKREAAHRFYLREGYLRTKTSAVFTKDLNPPAAG